MDRITKEQGEIGRLAELSDKASQGEWRVRRSSPQHIDIYAAPFEDADFVASELSPQIVAGIGLDYMPNAEFIAALVNWFRANHQSLSQESVRSEALEFRRLVKLLADLAITESEIEQEFKHGPRVIFEKSGQIAVRDVLMARRALQFPARVAEGEDVHSTEDRK